jgi:hypothetical protein
VALAAAEEGAMAMFGRRRVFAFVSLRAGAVPEAGGGSIASLFEPAMAETSAGF